VSCKQHSSFRSTIAIANMPILEALDIRSIIVKMICVLKPAVGQSFHWRFESGVRRPTKRDLPSEEYQSVMVSFCAIAILPFRSHSLQTSGGVHGHLLCLVHTLAIQNSPILSSGVRKWALWVSGAVPPAKSILRVGSTKDNIGCVK